MTTVAQRFVQCLENEGVETIFGIPGEENLDLMDALADSRIRFVTVRHEQGAAFMADVYGRLTGRAGVCCSTLGPGATNLMTGFADANMDHAPIVAIAGQGATTRQHKESHQVIDLVNLFRPVSKYSIEIHNADITAEVVRKAFKVAQSEKPGGAFISLPEDIAAAPAPDNMRPLKVQSAPVPEPGHAKLDQAAAIISGARSPIILAGNGVIRAGASEALTRFAEQLNIPVAETFMAKGAIPYSHPLSLGTIGMHAHDYVACGFDEADVVLCVGFDMVEYPPRLWHPRCDKQLVHVSLTPAEVDAHYILEAGVIGDISHSLEGIAARATRNEAAQVNDLRHAIDRELSDYAADDGFPVKPQRILCDTRKALGPDDILISDVGAHKMWVGRLYRCERPNTCLISNGFASMGIGVPGAVAAKLACPDRRVMTITGDGAFLMNAQELETAVRLGLALVIMVWRDNEYGLITWHQRRRFNRTPFIGFGNPDLVKFAESFGARGYRVESAEALQPTLEQAFADNTVVVVEVPVDYSENMRLTEKLARLFGDQ